MLANSEWMTVQEVANEMSVTEGRVRQWILGSALTATKFGKSWAVKRSDLQKFKGIERLPGNPNFSRKSS